MDVGVSYEKARASHSILIIKVAILEGAGEKVHNRRMRSFVLCVTQSDSIAIFLSLLFSKAERYAEQR